MAPTPSPTTSAARTSTSSLQREHGFAVPRPAPARPLAKRHYRSSALAAPSGPQIDARVPLLFSDDLVVSIARPDAPDPVYFANADADELFFVFEGSGLVRTMLGDLRYEKDDYVYIPRGLFYRCVPDPGPQSWLCLEAPGGVHIPSKWRNDVGQLRMDAPYCHRDFRLPTFRGPMDEGIRSLIVKRESGFHGFSMAHSPLDVVGWDGTVYPFVFPILNFQPRAGLVHLPPDWHGTFAAGGALICSFVPRVVDFHPEAIPCPYPHSSVDCDEIIFYCRGNFTSPPRRRAGQHLAPPGRPPARAASGRVRGEHRRKRDERARGHGRYLEAPLTPTEHALGVEDIGYQDSFLES